MRSLYPLLVPRCTCAADVSQAERNVTIRDSAGVRIIENSGADRMSAHTVLRLAELHTPDGALTAVPWGVSVVGVMKRLPRLARWR